MYLKLLQVSVIAFKGLIEKFQQLNLKKEKKKRIW